MNRQVYRVWEGKKECATRSYFCGQIWDEKRQLWKTVTDDFENEEYARNAIPYNEDITGL